MADLQKGYGLKELLDLLTLEKIETDLYRGESRDLGYGHLFGGQVISQGLCAAAGTAPPAFQPHSVHCCFMLAGDPGKPVVYEIDRIRDSSSFATRQVTALQEGRAISSLSASFHKPETGFDHQDPMPEVPPPEDLEDEITASRRLLGDTPPKPLRGLFTPKPIEFRAVHPASPIAPDPGPPERHLWFRAKGTLPADSRIHQMVLAFASDFYLASTCLSPHGRSFWSPDMKVTSLDHALWFHRDFQMDDWLLHVITSPTAANGRGLGLGRIYNRAGELVASVAQEGLVRQLHLTPDLLHP